MRKVIGAEVERAMERSDITHVEHHPCGMCGHMVYYFVEQGQLYFDSNCNCAGNGIVQRRDYEEIAAWINMQIKDEHRKSIMKKVGLAT